MNLIDLLNRKDDTMRCPEGVVANTRRWGSEDWRALRLPPGEPGLVLRRFVNSHPLWTRPDHIGWCAASPSGDGTLDVALVQDGAVLSRSRMPIGAAPLPVRIPWPLPEVQLDDATELVLRAEAPGPAEIFVHRIPSRDEFYGHARGIGVEIGPGPRPRILPSDATDVIYVEETPQDRWTELYDPNGKWKASTADWSNLRIGKAADLPVDDASLDFIFSSHVLEHLANPLGHLERWGRKLKAGGLVMAVVPDMASCKDRHMRPCGLGELLDEYEKAEFEPLPRHYLRHTRRLRRRGDPDPARALEMQARGESIHVHFYDRFGIATLLHEAVVRLGYREFQLTHIQNNLDFHFILRR